MSNLVVSDPDGAPNGTGGLRCEGTAPVIVHRSSMALAGSAHPMWFLPGEVEVDGFATPYIDFILDHAQLARPFRRKSGKDGAREFRCKGLSLREDKDGYRVYRAMSGEISG